MKQYFYLGFLTLFIIIPLTTYAQVNTISLIPRTEQPGIHQTLHFNTDFTFKKDKSQSYNIGYKTNWVHDSFLIVLKTHFVKNSKNNSLTKDQGFYHLRLINHWKNNIQQEVFLQNEYDDFMSLSNRIIAGVGYRFEQDLEYSEISYSGIGLLTEHVKTTIQNYEVVDRVRINSYLSFMQKFNLLKVNYALYIQPAISNFDDIKGLIDLTAHLPITANIHYRSALTLKYHSLPYDTLEPFNIEIKNALEFNF